VVGNRRFNVNFAPTISGVVLQLGMVHTLAHDGAALSLLEDVGLDVRILVGANVGGPSVAHLESFVPIWGLVYKDLGIRTFLFGQRILNLLSPINNLAMVVLRALIDIVRVTTDRTFDGFLVLRFGSTTSPNESGRVLSATSHGGGLLFGTARLNADNLIELFLICFAEEIFSIGNVPQTLKGNVVQWPLPCGASALHRAHLSRARDLLHLRMVYGL
jgi:hypothetical protein